MDNLCFGSFTWPNNPERYEEKCVREPIVGENGGLSGVGPAQRIITGNGVFCGATAYANFKALLVLMDRGDAADLIHPIWGTRKVYLTELVSGMEPREDFVSYTFTFREAESAST